jgi:LacI family transcriptional regulator
MAEKLRAPGVPVVDVSNGLEQPVFPRVITDSRAATRLAAQHLLERGLVHFGYCGDPRFHWSNLRSRFFSEHLRAAGRECRVYAPPSAARAAAAAEAEFGWIGRWIQGLPKPVGIMACYDMRGRQVLEVCRRLGLAVPDDVAVIGVHNDELLCDLCDPPLTSVIPNARRAGYEAAALLDRMMHGESVSPLQILVEPIGVAVRQSTDVVAVPDPKMAAAIRFMRDHACEGIGVGDVLEAIPMARSLFERGLKRLLGCTPHEHLVRVRLERVKSLLATTDLTLAHIAERAGFKHVEYLSVAFKRLTGLTPSRWRLHHQA